MADTVAPYVRLIENADPVKDKGPIGIKRWCDRLRRCRVLHMEMANSEGKQVVPIVWAKRVGDQVLCIGILHSQGDQAARFFLPLVQFLELQTAVVEG